MVQAMPPAPEVAEFFKALADETRLAIVRMLALSDLKAGEIGEQLHTPQNAVSYHLRQLRSAGLLHDRHSSLDARDVYYRIDLDRLHQLYRAAGAALEPGLVLCHSKSAALTSPIRVLFLCTHNSARSQLAEGLLRKLGHSGIDVYSAGSAPGSVHPLTVKLLDEWGIASGQHTSKSAEQFAGRSFDYVITVCDRVRENCPVFPGDPVKMHWSVPDPVAVADPEEQEAAFRAVGAELRTRVTHFLRRASSGSTVAQPSV